MSERELTPEAQAERAQFEAEYGSTGNCACHICPPCASCTHPGNPMNQEEDESAWVQRPPRTATWDSVPPSPAGQAAEEATFAEWLATEMPVGTVIGDPAWWAERIARRYDLIRRAGQQQGETPEIAALAQPQGAALSAQPRPETVGEAGEVVAVIHRPEWPNPDSAVYFTMEHSAYKLPPGTPLYAAPQPPSAPVGVEGLAGKIGVHYAQHESCKPGVPFYAFTVGELRAFAAALAQQPAVSMSREAAIDIARSVAWSLHDDHDYLPETLDEARTWMPHEWVIEAIRWQQPAAVDGAMVERALSARAGSWSVRQLFADEDEAPDIMRIALTAALAAQPAAVDEAATTASLRMMVGAATPVSVEIDPRGYTWSETYLDQALPAARAALAQQPAPIAPVGMDEAVVREYIEARDAYEDATRSPNSHAPAPHLKHGDPIVLRLQQARAALTAALAQPQGEG